MTTIDQALATIASEVKTLEDTYLKVASSNLDLTIKVNELQAEVDDLDAKIVTLTQQLADCEGTTPPPPPPPPIPETYFAKDFQGVSLVNKSNNTGKLFRNWGLDELAECSASINFVSGSTENYATAEMVADPTGTGRTVLQFGVKDDDPNWSGTSRAQVDMSFSSAIRNQDILHFSYRMYLHPDLATLKDMPDFGKSWFTLHEFWFEGASGENPAGGGRITLYVEEVVAGKLNLRADMQRTKTGQVTLWQEDNLNFNIPFGVWATWDVYLKRGEGTSGNYRVTVTEDGPSNAPATVFDIKKTTFLPDAPERRCGYFAPFKLYAGDVVYDWMRNNGRKLQAYYNDFKWFKA